MGDPVELGAAYSELGADELVFLDITATLESAAAARARRRAAAQLSIPFTVGGGIRTVADADALLSAGADKVSVNRRRSSAPSLITAPRRDARLARRSSSRSTPRAAASHARRDDRTARGHGRLGEGGGRAGAGEMLVTSIDADGTREGYDLEITARDRRRGLRPRDRLGRRRRGAARGRGARGRAGGAARLDPARGSRRLSRCATSCASWGWSFAMPPEGELRAAIVQDAD